MKRIQIVTALSLCMSFVLMAADAAKPAAQLNTPAKKFSYAMGMQMGGFMKQFEADMTIDVNVLKQGLTAAFEGTPTLMTPQGASQVHQEVMAKLQAKEKQARAGVGGKNKAEGDKFLAANGGKARVVTTASGLQYTVVRAGKGARPKATDTVSVHYSGKLINGEEFDSSYKRGAPAKFPVRGVIPGWSEGLQLMQVGGKYKLFVPSKLAYGERGAGRMIGANSTLVFDVELMGIE